MKHYPLSVRLCTGTSCKVGPRHKEMFMRKKVAGRERSKKLNPFVRYLSCRHLVSTACRLALHMPFSLAPGPLYLTEDNKSLLSTWLNFHSSLFRHD